MEKNQAMLGAQEQGEAAAALLRGLFTKGERTALAGWGAEERNGYCAL